MATLELTDTNNPAHTIKTLSYHEDRTAGAQVKVEFGEDELMTAVPAGKVWNVQATLLITERDA